MKNLKLTLPQKIVMFFVALVTVAVIPLSFAKSAYAVDCGPQDICFFDYTSYSGEKIYYYTPVVGQCYNLPSSFNDRTTSVWNNISYHDVRIWQNANCSGSNTLVYSALGGWGIPDLHNNAYCTQWFFLTCVAWLDNNITSFKSL